MTEVQYMTLNFGWTVPMWLGDLCSVLQILHGSKWDRHCRLSRVVRSLTQAYNFPEENTERPPGGESDRDETGMSVN